MWLSTDPAMGEYVPAPGKGADGLPGMGGVYNSVNMHVFAYAGNNPVNYTDPDGESLRGIWNGVKSSAAGAGQAVTGIGLMAAAGGTTVATYGAGTPIAFLMGVGGFGLFIAGTANFALGMGKIGAEINDSLNPNMPNANIPENLGAIIGAPFDAANGHDRNQGPGPAEKTGASVERKISMAATLVTLPGALVNQAAVENAFTAFNAVNDAQELPKSTNGATQNNTPSSIQTTYMGPAIPSAKTEVRVPVQRSYTGPGSLY
jgi:hypothetical protein